MKIYRKLVFDWDCNVIEEDSYEYDGPIAECKGGSSTTTTATPDWQQPYLQDIYNVTQGLSRQNIQTYPGQTVAGFSQPQQMAQTATMGRAMQGSPLLGAAQKQNLATTQGAGLNTPTIQGQYFNTPTIQGAYLNTPTAKGDYLNPNTNPWLAETYGTAARKATQTFGEQTMPEIRRMAMGQGAFGGTRMGVAEGEAMGRFGDTLGDIATGIYGPAYQTERQLQEGAIGRERGLMEQAYGQERGLQTQGYEAERARQQTATQFAPTLAEADYSDIGKLAAVGEEQQGMNQALIDEAIKRWEFSQLEPWQRLGMYSNLITGNVGSDVTSMRSGK